MQPIPMNLASKMSIAAEIDIKAKCCGLKTKNTKAKKKTKQKSSYKLTKKSSFIIEGRKREMTDKCKEMRKSVAQANHTLKRCQIKK